MRSSARGLATADEVTAAIEDLPHGHHPGPDFGIDLCHQPAACSGRKRLSFPVSGFRCR